MIVGTALRDRRLDVVRGWAVVLMLVDHVLAVALVLGLGGLGADVAGGVRQTVTRLSLPGFLVVAGWLWAVRGRATTGRRLLVIGVCGAWSTLCMGTMGLPTPEVLVVFALMAALVGPAVVRWPLLAAVLGLLAAVNLPEVWSGYQPGYVVLWLALGVLAARAGGSWDVPAWAWWPSVEAVGRAPLVWYVGHVTLLAAVAVALSA